MLCTSLVKYCDDVIGRDNGDDCSGTRVILHCPIQEAKRVPTRCMIHMSCEHKQAAHSLIVFRAHGTLNLYVDQLLLD